MFDLIVRRIKLFFKRDLRANLLFYVFTLKIFSCVCYCPCVCKFEYDKNNLERNVDGNKEVRSSFRFSFKKSGKQSIISAILLSFHLIMIVSALILEILANPTLGKHLTTTEKAYGYLAVVSYYSENVLMMLAFLLNKSLFEKVLRKQGRIIHLVTTLTMKEDVENISHHLIFLFGSLLFFTLNILQFPVSEVLNHYIEEGGDTFFYCHCHGNSCKELHPNSLLPHLCKSERNKFDYNLWTSSCTTKSYRNGISNIIFNWKVSN